MIEEWRPVVGYEGLYEVSNTGRVRSLDKYDSMNRFLRGRILRLFTDGLGYLRAQLYSNSKRKSFLVHRLVAQAFIPNPDNLPQVNHRDENPSNDNVENLEWCDAKYNSNYGTRNDRIRTTRLRNGTSTGLSREEYSKKWYQEHKNEQDKWHKEYYQENKDKRREYNKKYYQENREKICERQKEYYQENKKWYQEHKNEHNEKQREYYQKNKDRICEQKKEYRRKKKEEIQNNVKSLDD